jgi:hypothetical protein
MSTIAQEAVRDKSQCRDDGNMTDLTGLQVQRIRVDSHVLHSVHHTVLQRILAFRNLSIDDVIDNPVARTEVYYMWRIHNLIGRRCAAIERERHWQRLVTGRSIITD